MPTIVEIQQAITRLSAADRRAIRDWLAEQDAGEWDRQFAADVAAGKLDALGDEALRDFRAGRCADL